MEIPSTAPLLDRETKASERPADHKDELRLWLRMLTCSTLIESEIRTRLREEFETTLPRSTEREMSSSTWREPKDFCRLRMLRTLGVSVPGPAVRFSAISRTPSHL